ncbi:fructose-bisphosphate aldolase [candidate division KSB3 bacterium]|uniref:Fructose-bisphosphate aldolase n=1 Tax=candidate division KSB3 bacterium TaxID=2044937 RepID=A0A2G6KKN9_9BACT|nr:MAG: fructose-bisphosphate aldolase [candidate division KSB3 bacterium]
MSYVNLREMLSQATQEKYAIGAFNIVDPMTTEAVIRASEEKQSPVIIQTSVKTVNLYGYIPLATTVKTLAEKSSVPVALHLDHCKDLDVIRHCIDAGWSSVMIDASSFPFEENVRMTKEAVKMASLHNVTVEGELGAIVGVEDDIHVKEQDAHLADYEQAIDYVEATGVDLFAPAIGTAHGVYKGEPKIAFDLLKKIASAINVPIAIHGGTGLSDDVFQKVIRLGGAKVNISTQLKHAFKDSLAEYFQTNPDIYEPVKILTYMRDYVQDMTETFIDKFGSAGKA